MPSTEISRTCLLGGACPCAAAVAEPCNAGSAHAAAAALAAKHAKIFRLFTRTPVHVDLFGPWEFLSGQAKIRVPVRRTTRERIEVICGLFVTSLELETTRPRARTTARYWLDG